MKNLLTISLTAIITAGFMFTIQAQARPSDLWHIISNNDADIYVFEDRNNVCYVSKTYRGGGISCLKND